MFLIEFEGYDLTKYNDFLIECSQKDYTGIGTHKHHFLPKFMGGKNTKDNIIVLSVEDHYQAHIILADCFPENTRWHKGNIFGALYCKRWLEGNFEEISMRLSKIQKGKVQVGRPHTEAAKKKISESKKGVKHTPEAIEKMRIAQQGKTHTEEWKENMSETLKEQYASGKRIVNFGDPNSPGKTANRKRCSERFKLQTNEKNPSAKKIQHVESGEIFGCMKDAMNKFGITYGAELHREIKKGIFIILGDYPSTEKMKENHSKSKKIIHVETGEIFRSLTQAKDKFHISFPVLYRMINQGIFKYQDENDKSPELANFKKSKYKKLEHISSGFQMNSVKETINLFGLNQYSLEKAIKNNKFKYI